MDWWIGGLVDWWIGGLVRLSETHPRPRTLTTSYSKYLLCATFKIIISAMTLTIAPTPLGKREQITSKEAWTTTTTTAAFPSGLVDWWVDGAISR